jgi:hypothetical protein
MLMAILIIRALDSLMGFGKFNMIDFFVLPLAALIVVSLMSVARRVQNPRHVS